VVEPVEDKIEQVEVELEVIELLVMDLPLYKEAHYLL
jgi:hypothetical protein|tara:strand:- start:764 stop:874 length:111 start_codon:yes stop_codon:yes gene_type:complete